MLTAAIRALADNRNPTEGSQDLLGMCSSPLMSPHSASPPPPSCHSAAHPRNPTEGYSQDLLVFVHRHSCHSPHYIAKSGEAGKLINRHTARHLALTRRVTPRCLARVPSPRI